MPVPKGTKFRMKRNKDGSIVRLAIHNGVVVETKVMKRPTKKGKSKR